MLIKTFGGAVYGVKVFVITPLNISIIPYWSKFT
jgi:hypothetical protein